LFQGNDVIELDILCFYILIASLFGSFVLFLVKSIKLEMKSQKRVFLGYGLFLLLYGFTRLFFLIAKFYGDLDLLDYKDYYLTLGYFIGLLGVIIIIYIMEKFMLKTKKILTSITITVSVINLIAVMGLTTKDFALNMIYILLPSVIIAVCFVYLYLMFKTMGKPRRKATWAFIGIVTLFAGHIIYTSFFRSFVPPDFPFYISPIIMIIGVVIFTTSQLLIN
jgi:hypothetical protein